MPRRPLVITDADVKDPVLLGRALKQMTSHLAEVSSKLEQTETALRRSLANQHTPSPEMLDSIRESLQATGSHPLNVQNLAGKAAQAQKAFAIVVSSSGELPEPEGQDVGTIGIVDDGTPQLFVVITGLPKTWKQML